MPRIRFVADVTEKPPAPAYRVGQEVEVPDSTAYKYIWLLGVAELAQDGVNVAEKKTKTRKNKSRIHSAQRAKDQPGYVLKSRGGPWYDVEDSNGKRMNSDSLRKAEAEALLRELLSQSS